MSDFRVFVFLIFVFTSISNAKIRVIGSNTFKLTALSYLKKGKGVSPYLAHLIGKVESASKTVTIAPITNDKDTWHASGKKSRSHTEALDGKKRGKKRDIPTDCVIYINPKRIRVSHKTYKNGTLIHELVHAGDLLFGHYHRNYRVRERRAVFYENVWRAYFGKKLRTSYHKRFSTIDYQNAISAGVISGPFNHNVKVHQQQVFDWFNEQSLIIGFQAVDVLMPPIFINHFQNVE